VNFPFLKTTDSIIFQNTYLSFWITLYTLAMTIKLLLSQWHFMAPKISKAHFCSVTVLLWVARGDINLDNLDTTLHSPLIICFRAKVDVFVIERVCSGTFLILGDHEVANAALMVICTRVEQKFHHCRVLINYSKMQNTFPWNKPSLSATFTVRCTVHIVKLAT